MSRVKAGLIAAVVFIVTFALFRYILIDVSIVWSNVWMMLEPYSAQILIPPVTVSVVTLSSLTCATLVYQLLRRNILMVFFRILAVVYTLGLLALLLLKSRGIRGVNFNVFDIANQFVNDPVQLVFNILLFIPIGCLIMLLVHRLGIAIFAGFLVILVIECVQFIFALGMFDVVDIVLNGAGMTLGALLVDLVSYHWRIDRQGRYYVLRRREV